jgi:hypothetical protein
MTGRSLAGLRPALRHLRARWDRVGVPQDEDRVVADAAAYWSGSDGETWHSDSHWREGLGNLWSTVGKENLAISERLVRVTGTGLPRGRTLEWGAGGGANAVEFAPQCQEFVAVDVVASSLEECTREVRNVCCTPVRPLLIDLARPEAVIEELGKESCDLFLCFYVFELLPSKAYASRVLDIVRELLRPGSVAVIQVKYSTPDVATWSRRRAYRRDLASMTTFGIDEFWELATRHGLIPRALELVPSNDLDQRYAYYLLTKPS